MGTSQRDSVSLSTDGGTYRQYLTDAVGYTEPKKVKKGTAGTTPGKRKKTPSAGKEESSDQLTLDGGELLDPCTFILRGLRKKNELLPTLIVPAVLAYLQQIERFRRGARQAHDFARFLLDQYKLTRLDPMPSEQIIQAVRATFDQNLPGRYQNSAFAAAMLTLEPIMGERANLPIASLDEIHDFISSGERTSRAMLITFYTHYLNQILEYHASQEEPKFLSPKQQREIRKLLAEKVGDSTVACEYKARRLVERLDIECEKRHKCHLTDLDDLMPETVAALISAAGDDIQKILTSVEVKSLVA